MTVKELKAKLEKYKPEDMVIFEDTYDGSVSLTIIDEGYTKIEEIFNDEVVHGGAYFCEEYPRGINIYEEWDE